MVSVTAIRSGSGKEAARPAACLSSLVFTLRAFLLAYLAYPEPGGQGRGGATSIAVHGTASTTSPTLGVCLSGAAGGAAERPGGDFGRSPPHPRPSPGPPLAS